MFTTIALAALLCGEPHVHKVKRIEAEKIVVRAPDGKASITMLAEDDGSGVGVWMDDGKGGPTVTLYAGRGQTYIGLQLISGKFEGDQFAVFLDGDKPVIQYQGDDGKLHNVPFNALVKPSKAKAKKCPCATGGKCTCKGKCACKDCRCKKCPGKRTIKRPPCPCCPNGRCR